MQNLKTAIIGAGIIGLYLAWKLSETGLSKVTVFEKKEKIGKTTCSGLFSDRILEFIPESKNLIENKINSVLIHFPRRTVKVNFSRKFFVINHFQLDNLVASLAENSGAEIILNHPVNKLPEGVNKIIGCDGPNSIVRKSLRLPELDYRLGILGFIEKKDYSEYVEVWPFKAGFTQHPFKERGAGFIWKIPRGAKTEYGTIGNKEGVRETFEEFLNKNKLKLERVSSAIIPQGFFIPQNSSVTLCGDASGLTKPWSGGGVIWGLIAAGFLLKNFPDFLKYRNITKKFFLPKIIFSKLIIKIVYFLGFYFPWFLPRNLKMESDFLL